MPVSVSRMRIEDAAVLRMRPASLHAMGEHVLCP